MPGLSTQFYALPSELLCFARDCVRRYPVHLSALRYEPFEVVEVHAEDIEELFTTMPDHRRLGFTLDKPTLTVAHELEFARANRGHLRLDVGQQTSSGLEESWLCCRTDDLDALRLWKRIASQLKKWTHAGIRMMDPKTGRSCQYKTVRYSDGAMRLEASGVPMLAFGNSGGPPVLLGL